MSKGEGYIFRKTGKERKQELTFRPIRTTVISYTVMNIFRIKGHPELFLAGIFSTIFKCQNHYLLRLFLRGREDSFGYNTRDN